MLIPSGWIFLLMFLFPFSISQAQTVSDSIVYLPNRVEILDFQPSRHRCSVCLTIEENTKYVLQHHFREELEKGKIILRIIDITTKGDQNLVKAFHVQGRALFLRLVVREKTINTVDITDFAFLNRDDREKFAKALKYKIQVQLERI